MKPLQQAVITRCDCWVFYNVFAVSLNFPVKHLLFFLRDPGTGLAPDHLKALRRLEYENADLRRLLKKQAAEIAALA